MGLAWLGTCPCQLLPFHCKSVRCSSRTSMRCSSRTLRVPVLKRIGIPSCPASLEKCQVCEEQKGLGRGNIICVSTQCPYPLKDRDRARIMQFCLSQLMFSCSRAHALGQCLNVCFAATCLVHISGCLTIMITISGLITIGSMA